MARAHYVKKARKAVPSAGIKVGDEYWWWKFRRGGKRYSKTRPKASQLINADKPSRAMEQSEALQDLAGTIDTHVDIESIRSELSNIAESIREIAQEYRDSKENMPENLQSSPTAELCEENADNLDSWADEVEEALSGVNDEPDEIEDEELSEEELEEACDNARDEWVDEIVSAINDVSDSPL